MGRLYCHCLNVAVNYSGQLDRSEAISSEELLIDSSSSSLPDHLCNKKLTPVTLDIAGVTSKQSLLVKTYKVGSSWSISSCINCTTDVYAVYTSSDQQQKGRVFIFNNLIADPSTLKNHSDYSVVFHLVLRENKTQPHSLYSKQKDPIVKTVYEQSQSFLNEEEQKMEQNIREYEKKQREEFKRLKERVLEDRQRLLLSLNKAKVITSVEELSTDKDTSIDNRKEFTSVTVPIKQEFIMPARHITETSNDTDIFDFDEDMVENEPPGGLPSTASPFPFSSDDDDTDSSSNEGSLTLEDKYRVKTIPSSLPMSMPFLSNKQTSDMQMPTRQTPTDLARSIQKLALSVHDTGMFGDLPKPRVKNSHR